MSIHKLSAAGYDYLNRQAAALYATEKGRIGLTSYYTERGETPKVWIVFGNACEQRSSHLHLNECLEDPDTVIRATGYGTCSIESAASERPQSLPKAGGRARGRDSGTV
jgi:hypothetical protein